MADTISAGQGKGAFRDGSAQQIAVALLGIINMLTRAWLEDGAREPLCQQAEFVAELMLQGIAV